MKQLTEREVEAIRRTMKQLLKTRTHRALAKEIGMSQAQVGKIANSSVRPGVQCKAKMDLWKGAKE
jgi:transcriptional regulator with XRE-family HTH domain